jgi:hypothetical protein
MTRLPLWPMPLPHIGHRRVIVVVTENMLKRERARARRPRWRGAGELR